MILIKFLLILSFAFIFFQDFKERQVYWFLFPLVGLLCFILFLNNALFASYVSSFVMNLIFIISLISIVYGYGKFKLKLPLKDVLGSGDLFLFFALVFSFSTVTFIITFIFSLIFALTLHLALKNTKRYNKTVPLAGYMSLFFMMTFLAYWSGIINSIYSI